MFVKVIQDIIKNKQFENPKQNYYNYQVFSKHCQNSKKTLGNIRNLYYKAQNKIKTS